MKLNENLNHSQFYRLNKAERLTVTNQIADILRDEPRVLFAFIFGSFLTGTMFRDIDIGVFVAEEDISTFYDIEFELSQRIGKALFYQYPVEVKVINHAPEPFLSAS